jgi:hypothetical protein
MYNFISCLNTSKLSRNQAVVGKADSLIGSNFEPALRLALTGSETSDVVTMTPPMNDI